MQKLKIRYIDKHYLISDVDGGSIKVYLEQESPLPKLLATVPSESIKGSFFKITDENLVFTESLVDLTTLDIQRIDPIEAVSGKAIKLQDSESN